MPLAGVAFLVIAACAALAGLILGLARPRASRALRLLQALTLLAGLASLGLLTALVASGDATVAYAAEHRAPPGAPLGYRLAAVWAGQAGGLLLWVVETALVALAVSPRTQPRAVALLSAIQACLLGLALVANPFAPAAPSVASTGLNPLLQNPMMLIHPPMLFLGYALLAVPFAITLGALLERDPAPWPARVWPWMLTSALALTAGNGFGALWAYKTFGWGGFWSWDPVENTSFVPWALSLATVHALWLARGRGPWLLTAAAGSLAGFLTVLYGSFLARSGLLAGASVHAYVEGEKLFVYALGLLLGAGLVLSLVLLLRARARWVAAPATGTPEATPSPRLVPVAWGTRLLLALSGLVLVGMTLPIFHGKPDTTAYDTAALPFALAIMILLIWPARSSGARAEAGARVLVIVVFGLMVIATLLSLGLSNPGGIPQTVGFVLAPWLIVACIVALLLSLWGVFFNRRPWLQRGAWLAHLGVASLLLGALVSGYGSLPDTKGLAVGQEVMVANDQPLKLVSVSEPRPGLKVAELSFQGRTGQVSIEETPSFETSLKQAWIIKRLWGDFYVSPQAINAQTQEEIVGMPAGAMVEFTIKPGMRLVWLGMWLIAAGLLLALIRRTAGRRPTP